MAQAKVWNQKISTVKYSLILMFYYSSLICQSILQSNFKSFFGRFSVLIHSLLCSWYLWGWWISEWNEVPTPTDLLKEPCSNTDNYHTEADFAVGASGKEPVCQCKRLKRCGFDPWVRKIPWRRACNPLQYSCLENPMDRGAWWATVHGVAKSQTWLVSKHRTET